MLTAQNDKMEKNVFILSSSSASSFLSSEKNSVLLCLALSFSFKQSPCFHPRNNMKNEEEVTEKKKDEIKKNSNSAATKELCLEKTKFSPRRFHDMLVYISHKLEGISVEHVERCRSLFEIFHSGKSERKPFVVVVAGCCCLAHPLERLKM